MATQQTPNLNEQRDGQAPTLESQECTDFFDAVFNHLNGQSDVSAEQVRRLFDALSPDYRTAALNYLSDNLDDSVKAEFLGLISDVPPQAETKAEVNTEDFKGKVEAMVDELLKYDRPVGENQIFSTRRYLNKLPYLILDTLKKWQESGEKGLAEVKGFLSQNPDLVTILKRRGEAAFDNEIDNLTGSVDQTKVEVSEQEVGNLKKKDAIGEAGGVSDAGPKAEMADGIQVGAFSSATGEKTNPSAKQDSGVADGIRLTPSYFDMSTRNDPSPNKGFIAVNPDGDQDTLHLTDANGGKIELKVPQAASLEDADEQDPFPGPVEEDLTSQKTDQTHRVGDEIRPFATADTREADLHNIAKVEGKPAIVDNGEKSPAVTPEVAPAVTPEVTGLKQSPDLTSISPAASKEVGAGAISPGGKGTFVGTQPVGNDERVAAFFGKADPSSQQEVKNPGSPKVATSWLDRLLGRGSRGEANKVARAVSGVSKKGGALTAADLNLFQEEVQSGEEKLEKAA